jgi:hypothetical protein
MKYSDAWEDLKTQLGDEIKAAEAAEIESEGNSRLYYVFRSRRTSYSYVLMLMEQLEWDHE